MEMVLSRSVGLNHPLFRKVEMVLDNPKVQGRLYMLGASLMVVALMLLATVGIAGTDGDAAFGDAYRQIAGFAQGFLGKLVTLLMVVAGLIMGIARQSVMSLVVGVGMGIAIYNAPTIIDTLVGAVL